MNITEVRIMLVDGILGGNDKIRAFASITIDDLFVVRDLKVVENLDPEAECDLFIAMPSRKVLDRCPMAGCGGKNILTAKYCNRCGSRLADNRSDSPRDCHADIAHPISHEGRELIKGAVLEAYYDELELSGQDDPASDHAEPVLAMAANAPPINLRRRLAI